MENQRLLCVAVVAVLGFACTVPTSVCGCPPERSTAFVTGSMTTSEGTPITSARLFFDPVPLGSAATAPFVISGSPDAITDETGAFGGTVYSLFSPGSQELRVAVIPSGTADTIRLTAGPVVFRTERERPDTVVLALSIP